MSGYDRSRSVKSCGICGGPLGRRRYLYCSRACQKRAEAAARRREQDRARAVKSCGICGGPLPYRHRKYCSPECLKQALQADRAAKDEQARTMKPCARCGHPVPKGRSTFCSPECLKLARKAAAAANRRARLAAHRKYAHGAGIHDWTAQAFAAQEGRCYLCEDPVTSQDSRIDHDHRCCPPSRSCPACRRGLAHPTCNALIGMAGDDPARLRTIARNLERAQRRVDRRLLQFARPALFDPPGRPSQPQASSGAPSPNGARRRAAAASAPLALFDLPAPPARARKV